MMLSFPPADEPALARPSPMLLPGSDKMGRNGALWRVSAMVYLATVDLCSVTLAIVLIALPPQMRAECESPDAMRSACIAGLAMTWASLLVTWWRHAPDGGCAGRPSLCAALLCLLIFAGTEAAFVLAYLQCRAPSTSVAILLLALVVGHATKFVAWAAGEWSRDLAAQCGPPCAGDWGCGCCCCCQGCDSALALGATSHLERIRVVNVPPRAAPLEHPPWAPDRPALSPHARSPAATSML